MPLLVSDVLVGLIPEKTTYCGNYAVKGIGEPLKVHALQNALPLIPPEFDVGQYLRLILAGTTLKCCDAKVP